ncbi:MAG: hypothetical protein JW819_10070 [Candidatus Krumholzibacteriota bacterium]|nr:hypothetical protein [Candidatus Krumholzibacteriota bacterium]
MPSNPMDPKKLESIVTGIHDVTGCRIVLDAQGRIAEIHVTADTDRDPRFIARDVNTLLTVKSGLDIDYRKISVARVSEPKPAPPEEAAVETKADETGEADEVDDEDVETLLVEDEELPALPPRPRLERVEVAHAAGEVQAAVTLSLDGRRATGEFLSADTPDGHMAAVVHATLEAVLLLYETDMRFTSPACRRLELGREAVLVVYLDAVSERDVLSFAGAAVIRQDRQQAAVLATLDALNRLTGLWNPRGGKDFEID